MNTMNNIRTLVEAQIRHAAPVVATAPRREYRARDFGIGYGNSSGYALAKRYTSDWGQSRFRCA